MGFSPVRPTISPFSTVKSDLSSGVIQPVRSLPLNSGRNPADSWAEALAVVKPAAPRSKSVTARQIDRVMGEFLARCSREIARVNSISTGDDATKDLRG